MGCLKKITMERLPSTVSGLVLDNKWTRDCVELVEQPKKYPQSLLPWARLAE